MRIAWVLPKIIKASGGLRTIFNNIKYLINEGYECHVYIEGDDNVNELKKIVENDYGVFNLYIHSGWSINENYDLVFGTMWHTLYYIEKLMFIKKKAYFIQDFEPYFYPMGDNYLLAENTYRFQNYFHLTIGRWLCHKLSVNYGINARYIDFCVDNNIYKPLKNSAKEFAVCFIYQPEKPHRGPFLAVESLKLLKKLLPSIKIYSFGTDNITNLPKDFIHLGILTPNQINELYNKCIAGLCISSSNPSRIPFEMIAAGLPVVDIYKENNLYDMPEGGILLAEPKPDSIAFAILKIISDSVFRENLINTGKEYIKEKNQNLEKKQLLSAVNFFLSSSKKSVNFLIPEKTYKSRGFNKTDLIKISKHYKYELLTFDIWDTVLRRSCHPEEIKLYTARYVWLKYNKLLKESFNNQNSLLLMRSECEKEIGLKQKGKNFDDEYDIKEVFKLWLLKIFKDEFNEEYYDKIVDELVKLELSFEEENSYLDNQIIHLLKSIPSNRKIFLSDFYMNSEQIKYLLIKKGFPKELMNGYSSVDLGYNKRSGNLYDNIQNILGVSKHNWIHVGDNVYSDYLVPMSKGIEAKLYVNEDEEKNYYKIKRYEKRRTDRTSYFVEIHQSYSELYRNDISSSANELYNLGLQTSLLLLNFILFIIEEVVAERFDKIYFFTREGEFFIKIYNEIKNSKLFDFELPQAEILEVSRIATFAASLSKISLDEFMRLWNLYSKQSINAFFKSLNTKPEDYLDLITKYNLNLEDEILYPWKDERIISLFSDEAFQKKLLKHVKEQKEIIIKYFETKGIKNDGSNIAIVDIGWRGTIQDNLSYIFDKNIFYGYYFGLLKYLNVQPPNSLKRAFLIDQNKNISRYDNLLKYVSPIEMLFNYSGGSVKNYAANGNKIFVNREINPSEEKVYLDFTRYFQEGIIDAIPKLCKYIRRYSLSSQEIKNESIKILEKLINDPPKIIVNAYFSLNHNESFGVGKYEDKNRFLKYIDLVKEAFFKQDFENLEKLLHETTWPQGFIKLCGIRYNQYYNKPYIISTNEKQKIANLCNESLKAFKQGNLDIAIKYALEAYSMDTNKPSTLYLLYTIQKNICYEKAIYYLKRIIHLYPEEPRANNELARIFYQLNNFDKALFFLKKIKDDNYILAYLNLSKLYLKKYLQKNGRVKDLSNEILIKYVENLEGDNILKNLTSEVDVSLEEKEMNDLHENIKPIFDISIIIPTFNGLDYTLKSIESFVIHTDVNYELIIVDNNSEQEFRRYLTKIGRNIKNVKLILNDTNLGFPAAVNQGIKVADGKYLLIANNDIIITNNSIERLIEIADSEPQIGIVAPISNEVSGLQKDENAIYNSLEEMHKYAAEVREKNKGQVLHFPRVAFLCTLIKRDVIEKIGGLDERFSPGNYEDDDFCLRAQLAGFKTVIAKDVFIHHYGSKSFKANGIEAYKKRLEINRQVFVNKWGATPEEIWLQNKTIKNRQIHYPINKDLFKQYFERTQIHLADNELKFAQESIIKAIENYKEEHTQIIRYDELLNLAGNIFLADNNIEKAQELFEKELNLNPQSSSACYGLGQVFLAQENFEAAKIMFEWAVKNNPENKAAKDALEKVNEILGYELSHSSLDGG